MLKGGVMDAGRIPGRTMMCPYNLPLSFLARVLFFHIDTFCLRDSHILCLSVIVSKHILRPRSSPHIPTPVHYIPDCYFFPQNSSFLSPE